MEQLKENKRFKILFIIFILLSVIHIVYATITMRGLYCDGAFIMLEQLNNFSSKIYKLTIDSAHPRFMMSFLMQFPVMIAHALFHIKNKFVLTGIYSFVQFAIPVILSLFNFMLTKRTKRLDILFWNIFTYGVIICPFMIFSVVESIIGFTLHFILWNYLCAKIDYKKTDIIFILFLLTMMFGTYEYVTFLGIIFFFAHFHYVMKEESFKIQFIKILIGFGSLASAIYNIIFMIRTDGEQFEVARFIVEATNYFPHLLELNTIFSIITIILLIIISFKKSNISKVMMGIIIVVYITALIYLLNTPLTSIYPMWEGHLRTVPCWFLPILFLVLLIKDIVSDKINENRYINLICIALVCCIFQSVWQMVNTYYWNKNINYMKNELQNSNELLYIPSEHPELSGFHNKELRRYIWHGIFPATSILFTEEYKQKTLLLSYDEQQDPGNGTFRDILYVISDKKISIPFGAVVDIKNDYWDLTDCAKALDEYNKENKIKTNR